MSVNTPVFAPMPSASVRMAVALNRGACTRRRNANLMSAQRLSSLVHCQISRLRSSARAGLPKHSRAARLASARLMPAATSASVFSSRCCAISSARSRSMERRAEKRLNQLIHASDYCAADWAGLAVPSTSRMPVSICSKRDNSSWRRFSPAGVMRYTRMRRLAGESSHSASTNALLSSLWSAG